MAVYFILGLASVAISLFFFITVFTNVSDCSLNNYYLICTEGVSEKGLYTIIGVFFVIIGLFIMKYDRQN